jgi:hypothetical protein
MNESKGPEVIASNCRLFTPVTIVGRSRERLSFRAPVLFLHHSLAEEFSRYSVLANFCSDRIH